MSHSRTRTIFKKMLFSILIVSGGMGLFAGVAQAQDPGNSAVGMGGAVSSGDPDAVQAGIGILEQGGNAADAAAAAIFALAVTDFGRFAMGGEAPLIIFDANTQQAKVLSGLGRAPLDQSAINWYNTNGIPTNGDMKAAPTPSVVHMLMTLLEVYGSMSFERVVEPTLALLDEGGPSWYPRLATTLRKMIATEQAAVGSREAKIAAARERFYTGDIADDLEAWYIAGDGFLRKSDLAAQTTHIEDPVSINYRGYSVLKADTWTQGPMLLQSLRLLENFDLSSFGHLSADYIHVVTEAMKLAFADRDEYYGDPLFADVPLANLLSDGYTDARVPLIGMDAASQDRRPGDPFDFSPLTASEFNNNEHAPVPDTTTVVVADRFGNFIAATPSCNVFGNKGNGGDTGVTHGNRLRSLNTASGHPNQIEAGKRPRITLTPTMVLQNGKPFLGISVAGGDKQEPTSLNVLLNTIEFDMLPAQAVTEPRFSTDHRENSFNPTPNRDSAFGVAGDLQVNTAIPSSVRNNLSARGHNLRTASGNIADPSAILVNDGTFYAAGDPAAGRHANAILNVQTPVAVFNFDDDAEGFVYLDDAFRGTDEPTYASGAYTSSNGFGGGGGLRIILGGVDNADVNGMSGGFQRTFSLSTASHLSISLRYRLEQASNYESNEFSQVLVNVDSIQPGNSGNDYVQQISGNGNGGSARTTTWKLFQADLGTFAAGDHTITVGGYSNLKTYHDESTEILIDAVVISALDGVVDMPPVVQFTRPAEGSVLSGDIALGGINATGFDPDIGNNDGDGITSIVFELINISGTVVNSHQDGE